MRDHFINRLEIRHGRLWPLHGIRYDSKTFLTTATPPVNLHFLLVLHLVLRRSFQQLPCTVRTGSSSLVMWRKLGWAIHLYWYLSIHWPKSGRKSPEVTIDRTLLINIYDFTRAREFEMREASAHLSSLNCSLTSSSLPSVMFCSVSSSILPTRRLYSGSMLWDFQQLIMWNIPSIADNLILDCLTFEDRAMNVFSTVCSSS